jgi:hypothetical protein
MKKPVKKAPTKATAKKAISEYGGMEKYASKAAKMKHEKAEGKKVEMKEKAMSGKKTMAKGAAKKKPYFFGN